jgi:hypothetical protein
MDFTLELVMNKGSKGSSTNSRMDFALELVLMNKGSEGSSQQTHCMDFALELVLIKDLNGAQETHCMNFTLELVMNKGSKGSTTIGGFFFGVDHDQQKDRSACLLNFLQHLQQH